MDSPSHSDVFSSSCVVCYNRYDINTFKPSTLSCGHTLCIPCARQLDKCPICKQNYQNRNEPKPNYEMMNMIDSNRKFRLKWLETLVKNHSPELWNSLKSEEERFIGLIKDRKARYEKMEREMKDQKEMVEKSYSEYMDNWKKSFDLLVQSKKDEYKTLSELKETIKQISSLDSLLEMQEVQQPQLKQFLVQLQGELERFRSEVSKLKSSYQKIMINPPSIQNISVEIQIYNPNESKSMVSTQSLKKDYMIKVGSKIQPPSPRPVFLVRTGALFKPVNLHL